MTSAPNKSQVAGAAGVLRELLAKVDSGELEAPGRRGKAVRARIESAALALELAARSGR